MISINNFFKFPLYLLLVLLPFWDVIVPLATRLSPSLFYVVGPIRYEIMIIFSLFSLVYSIKYKPKFKIFTFFLFVSYIIICIFSLLVSDASFILKLEAVKLQLLVILYSFSLYLMCDVKFIPNINVIKKIFYMQLILVVCFAVLEILDQNLLSIIYNRPLDKIQHIYYFSSQRVISLIGNPINLGAFILICISFNFNKFSTGKSNIGNYILFVLSGFVIYMTLSRLSLLAYGIVVLLVFYKKNKTAFYFMLVLSLISILSFMPSLNFTGVSAERMVSIFSVDTYMNNARVVNWNYALESFTSIFDYIFGIGFGYSNPSKEYMEMYGSFIVENTFFSIFIELGLFGVIIFIMIILRFYHLALDYYKVNGDFAFISFLMFFLLFSIGNDFHRNMPFSFYFWFFFCWLEIMKLNNKLER
ncbi:TPA: O-antigen ligase family protein [Photobacterium damselae]